MCGDCAAVAFARRDVVAERNVATANFRHRGGPHGVAQAVQDIETLREALKLPHWTVLGHSWGADLGLAYALAHPGRVRHLVSFAGTGVQYDRDWKAAYEAGKHLEADFEVEWNPEVHTALRGDWRRYIKEPELFSRLSRSEVSVTFLHMGADIRPGWPARQLAALLPRAAFVELPGASHNAWLETASQLQAALISVLDGSLP